MTTTAAEAQWEWTIDDYGDVYTDDDVLLEELEVPFTGQLYARLIQGDQMTEWFPVKFEELFDKEEA